MATVNFTEMKHGTQEDYAILQEFEHKFNAKTAHRLFEQLERQGHESIEGYAISRMVCNLQPELGARGLMMIGLWLPYYMISAMVWPHRITTAWQQK